MVMRVVLSWLVGMAVGAAVGALFVMLFSPVSGDDLRENLKEHYADARHKAHLAAKERRAELERELVAMHNARR